MKKIAIIILLTFVGFVGFVEATDISDETQLRQIILQANAAGGTPTFVNLKTQVIYS